MNFHLLILFLNMLISCNSIYSHLNCSSKKYIPRAPNRPPSVSPWPEPCLRSTLAVREVWKVSLSPGWVQIHLKEGQVLLTKKGVSNNRSTTNSASHSMCAILLIGQTDFLLQSSYMFYVQILLLSNTKGRYAKV